MQKGRHSRRPKKLNVVYYRQYTLCRDLSWCRNCAVAFRVASLEGSRSNSLTFRGKQIDNRITVVLYADRNILVRRIRNYKATTTVLCSRDSEYFVIIRGKLDLILKLIKSVKCNKPLKVRNESVIINMLLLLGGSPHGK